MTTNNEDEVPQQEENTGENNAAGNAAFLQQTTAEMRQLLEPFFGQPNIEQTRFSINQTLLNHWQRDLTTSLRDTNFYNSNPQTILGNHGYTRGDIVTIRQGGNSQPYTAEVTRTTENLTEIRPIFGPHSFRMVDGTVINEQRIHELIEIAKESLRLAIERQEFVSFTRENVTRFIQELLPIGLVLIIHEIQTIGGINIASGTVSYNAVNGIGRIIHFSFNSTDVPRFRFRYPYPNDADVINPEEINTSVAFYVNSLRTRLLERFPNGIEETSRTEVNTFIRENLHPNVRFLSSQMTTDGTRFYFTDANVTDVIIPHSFWIPRLETNTGQPLEIQGTENGQPVTLYWNSVSRQYERNTDLVHPTRAGLTQLQENISHLIHNEEPLINTTGAVSASNPVLPLETVVNLEPRKDMFLVQRGMYYDCYSIKMGEKKGLFIDIKKGPKLLEPGFVTHENQLYNVSIKDLIKGRVYVGNKHQPATTSSSTESNHTIESGTPVSANVNESSASAFSGLEINKDIDLAWTEQIDALLYNEDPEAEWEII